MRRELSRMLGILPGTTRDGGRKRGVHASPCVVPKDLFVEKVAPSLRHEPARIHANLRGATCICLSRVIFFHDPILSVALS